MTYRFFAYLPDDGGFQTYATAEEAERDWHAFDRTIHLGCPVCPALDALAESLADEGYRRADDTGDLRDRDTCPECGRMVHDDAPAGLCPRCEDEARGDDTDGDLDEYEGDAEDLCEECGDRDQTCEHGCCSRCCACWEEPHAADPDLVDGEG